MAKNFRDLALKYEDLLKRTLEISDKYAAALGREAELKERIRILESKMRPG